MTQFKAALNAVEAIDLFAGTSDYNNTMFGQFVFPQKDTIRLALRISHSIQAEPMSQAMYEAGEKAQTEGFVIQNPARIFQAMIEQMLREIENEN